MPINSPNVFTVVGDAFLTGIGGGTGTLSYQLDEYDVSGTWTMPANCIGVEVWLMEGASGGWSGARQATNVLAWGGYGGVNGTQMFAFFLPQQIATIVPIIIGSGGTGGASVTNDNSNGTPGTAGGGTYFGTFFGAEGAQPYDDLSDGGVARPSTTGSSFPIKSLENQWWGDPPTFSSAFVFSNQVLQAYRAKIFSTFQSGSSSTTMSPLLSGTVSASARGGSVSAANVATVGFAGGPGYNYYDIVTIYNGQPSPANLGDNGFNGLDNYTDLYSAGSIMLATNNTGTFKTGQTASGGSSSTTGTGGAGGNGGKYGLGGGGGGATRNGFNSGAGGAGAQGCMKVLSVILN